MNKAGRLIGRALLAFALSCSAPPLDPIQPRGTAVVEAIESGDRARRQGGTEVAHRHYRDALDREPAQRRAHVGMQELLLDQGLDLDARRTYRTLGDPFLSARLEASAGRAGRLAEQAEEPYRSLALGRLAWREAQGEKAAGHFRRATRLDPGESWGWTSLGRALLAQGRVGDAYEAFRNAIWIAPGDPMGWFGLSRAAQRLGRADAAFVAARAAFERAPRDKSAARRLLGAAGKRPERDRRQAAGLLGSTASVPALLGAATLHSALGDRDARTACLARAREAGALDAEVDSVEPVELEPRVQRFVDRFVRGVSARYRHYRITGEAESLPDLRDWARALYEECSAEQLEPPGPIESFAFVGELIDATERSGEPLVRALARHGLLLILGRRSGGPPEAMLAQVVRRTKMERVRSRGATIEREAVWVGKRHLSGYVEWLGGGDLAGLALGNIVLVDLHAAAEWEGELRRRRARMLRERAAAQPALRDTPVDSVEDPAGVADRLLLDSELDIAAQVLTHEDAHLVDADRYLPGRGSITRGLGLAWRSGFSARGVLATLERNAQLTAIAEGAHPRSALAVCCAALRSGGVHAEGYTRIVAGMVRLVLADPARYPAVDVRRVVVQQLHRLTGDEIRSLAIALQTEWGVR